MNKKDVFKELEWRGIINNFTDKQKLIDLANSSDDYGIYVGFDPSFHSLHLGNYVMIRILKIFKKYGWKTVGVIGGATGMIGDPSGKSVERKLLDEKQVLENIKGIQKQIKFLAEPNIIFDNKDIWLKINVVEYLREIGKLFQVNRMLEKDIVKSRLENGISYSEFSYSILQSWDWITLFKLHNIAIQCGGSDQWGNITAGVDVFRKTYGDNHKAAGITINLLLKKDGKKFGKSEEGALYLNKDITNPYQVFQFLINQQDEDLEKLFKFFTDYDEKKIIKILDEHQKNPKKRLGQHKLTQTIMDDIYDLDEYNHSLKIAKLFFEEKYNSLLKEEIDFLFNDKQKIFTNLVGENIVDQLNNFDVFSSKREIREFLNSGAIKINGRKINDQTLITKKDCFFDEYLILKKGKKTFYLISLSN